MESSIVRAFINICKYDERPNLKKYKEIRQKEKDSNSAKAMGSELESYTKDIFTDAYMDNDINKKLKKYNEKLSYLGGSKNPPDFIIKKGAAIEVKKVESYSELQLNSSYPKKVLKSTSDKITNECKKSEPEWNQKDMVYVIGNQEKNTKLVQSIWLIDAKCYIADEEKYSKLFDIVKDKIKGIEDFKETKTKELARIGGIDTLDITKLRVRPMWTLEHPNKVFKSHIENDDTEKFRSYALIYKNTFNSYPEADHEELKKLIADNKITCIDIKVKDPDNSKKELDAILLKLIID